MNCAVTLTAEEFKTVHNALCGLDSVAQMLEDVLKPELYVKLAKAASEIRRGLAGAYAQESADFDRKHDLFDEARTELGCKSIWSVYDVEDLSTEHPFAGAKEILYKDHWGGKPVRVPLIGQRWLDLYIAADHAIAQSGDEHHIYIEHFEPADELLILTTGS
jgi:hypothetical protein